MTEFSPPGSNDSRIEKRRPSGGCMAPAVAEKRSLRWGQRGAYLSNNKGGINGEDVRGQELQIYGQTAEGPLKGRKKHLPTGHVKGRKKNRD